MGMCLTAGDGSAPATRFAGAPASGVGNAALMQQGAASALIRIGSIEADIKGVLDGHPHLLLCLAPGAAIDVHEVHH